MPDLGQRAYCADESGAVRASADGKAASCLVSGEVVQSPPLPRAAMRMERGSLDNEFAFRRASQRDSSLAKCHQFIRQRRALRGFRGLW
jgi:hypothetical protein